MKFPESWLRSFVNPEQDSAALGHALTMAGLEVEELEAVAPPFTQVVVAQVLTVVKHPDADRLNVCTVDVGAGNPVQIVCGAPNVAPGLKVPCAQPGAVLPGDFRIKVAKVRGIESSGMLCSAKELGIAEEASGLLILPADAPVGTSIRQYLELDDHCYTLKLTPNRADCLGLTGIAREVAALTGAPLSIPAVAAAPVTLPDRLPVKVDAPDLCGRFSGRILRGVNARAATPEWMKRRLERAGQRSLSALVDISNYVMLELNRPNHVFDLAKVTGGLTVRWAREGETLELLNGQTITLTGDVGVIADEAGVESLAGIMGGESTSVTLDTTDVFVEAAFWWPSAIQGRSRRYAFTSDAGHRFERGVDYADTVAGVERVTQLILEICGGAAGPVDDQVLRLPERHPVRLRTARVAKLLGISLGDDAISNIFHRLGLAHVRVGGDFMVTPPSWRFDLEIEADLIEEIARLHGYDNIPSPPPQASLAMLPQTEASRPVGRLRRRLAARGFQEVVNFAFVEEAWEKSFAPSAAVREHPIRLANPIASQMSVMRSSLIGGLVANLGNNLRRKQTRVRVFETGRVFQRTADNSAGVGQVAGFHQPWHLAALAWGDALPEQWGAATRAVDFYDLKADLEALFAPRTLRWTRSEHPALHPGRAAQVLLDDVVIGHLGELHPLWVQQYQLPTPPVVFEVALDAALAAGLPQFAEVSRFPPVVRDLAVVVAQELSLQSILDGLKPALPALVRDLRLFDVYAGKGVEAGKKSLAFRIVMQDTQKTLQDAEVDSAIAAIVALLAEKFGGQLRA